MGDLGATMENVKPGKAVPKKLCRNSLEGSGLNADEGALVQ
jgi:hypothetical protein